MVSTSLPYCHFESTNGSYFSVRSWPINGRQRKRSCSRRRLKSFHALRLHERTYEPIVLRQRKRSRLDIVFLQFKTFGKKRRSINVT